MMTSRVATIIHDTSPLLATGVDAAASGAEAAGAAGGPRAGAGGPPRRGGGCRRRDGRRPREGDLDSPRVFGVASLFHFVGLLQDDPVFGHARGLQCVTHSHRAGLAEFLVALDVTTGIGVADHLHLGCRIGLQVLGDLLHRFGRIGRQLGLAEFEVQLRGRKVRRLRQPEYGQRKCQQHPS
jgi:hypothetical protein